MQHQDYVELLKENGYFTLDFPKTEPIFDARQLLEKQLRELTGQPEISLENYHQLGLTDEQHVALQYKISEYFRNNELAKKIICENVSIFQDLIGIDLDIQRKPYLRIARPGKTCDNIGYHRDTFYGGFPEELSVVIPFVDLPGSASLSVEPGSHVLSEDRYQVEQSILEDEKEFKKSTKHSLGFLYAPKTLVNSEQYKMKPIPLKAGQALVFMLSTLHGSVVNGSNVSRWTTDVRVKNALANIDISSRPEYYESLSKSALTACCESYYLNNSNENS